MRPSSSNSTERSTNAASRPVVEECEVLEECRVRGWRLHPVCTYVRRYLGSHTEYLALLDDRA